MRVLITGARGMLGSRLTEVAAARGHRVVAYNQPEMQLEEPEGAAALVRAAHPDVLVHAAGMTDVDGCETDAERALLVNGTASGALAEAAADLGARCLYVSTDYVFAGRKEEPYVEDDPTEPRTVYGRSKLLGEEETRRHGAAVVRLSWSFGPDGKNFVATIAGKLRAGEQLSVVDDQRGAPTYTRDSAEAIVDLAEAETDGVYHCCNAGATTWFGFARAIAEAMGLPADRIAPCASDQFPRPAQRPKSSLLGGARLAALRGREMPPWEAALRRYLEEEGWLSP